MFYFVELGNLILYELAILGSAWLVFNIDYKQITTNIDPRFFGMRILYQYSKTKTHWQKYWSESYNNNFITKFSIDSLNYTMRFANSKWQNVRLEPYSTQWMSKCILNQDDEQLKVTFRDDGERYVFFGCTFDETFYSNGDWPKERAQESYSLECTIQSAFSKVSDLEILMLMKSDERYLSRVIYTTDDSNNTTTIVSWLPSSVRFLSVEYRHPEMDRPISLDINRSFYLEGNHLLSAAFVRRCLEYHCSPKSYYFDMNYTLTVMDNEINMIELKSHQYVVLEKDGYKII